MVSALKGTFPAGFAFFCVNGPVLRRAAFAPTNDSKPETRLCRYVDACLTARNTAAVPSGNQGTTSTGRDRS